MYFFSERTSLPSIIHFGRAAVVEKDHCRPSSWIKLINPASATGRTIYQSSYLLPFPEQASKP
jgi:hypothetical protein